jgi:hypothetical protein
MDSLKNAIVHSPAIRPINYSSSLKVILAMDSSHIACGWILFQVDEEGRHRPARFGSITWNERESRYSQAKIELYGLFRALRAAKVWLIGLKTFSVEVDAKYIRGMLNNPDIQPNAAVNRWIAGISLFDFTLRHVPGNKHVAADGLSRRPPAPEDAEDGDETAEDVDEWVDEVLGCGIWMAKEIDEKWPSIPNATVLSSTSLTPINIPISDTSLRLDNDLHTIRTYLSTLTFPPSTPAKDQPRLIKRARQFLVQGQCLWRKEQTGRNQLVIFTPDRYHILHQTHDELGHKGFYSTRRTITDRFWWPSLDVDLS